MTREDLAALLDYEPETGVFRWKVRSGRATVGMVAGTAHNRGYWQINVRGKLYLAHRLAWFITHGEWPAQDTDHINGDKQDNRIANLRLASRSENMANTGPKQNSASGIKGVWLFKRTGKWAAGYRKDGRMVHVGYFDTVQEAEQAHRAAYEKAFGIYARAA
jgi:hypothetical protein